MVGNDKKEFTEAVLRLLDDDKLHASKSAEAVAWSHQYRVEVTTSRIARLYKILAAQRAQNLKIRSGIR